MVRGSCLCGDVVWEVAGELELMTHCHCSMCRKQHGAPFATYVAAAAETVRLVAGGEKVQSYESSPDFSRPFCPRCGSVVIHEPSGDRTFMAAGCLDGDPETRAVAHIFATSKAEWYEISDDLPRYDAYPPGWGLSVVERERSAPSGDGVLRGSCLCGGVSWEARGEITAFRNCHCRRCRKARSAAHASNLFCDRAGFQWLAGEERLRTYEVPEAERFAVVFCGVCGSAMPRLFETRVVVPAGCIDGDPGVRLSEHIFVGSKAEWYPITDRLPRHHEYPPG